MAMQFLQQIAIDETTGRLFDAVSDRPLLGGVTDAQILAAVTGAVNSAQALAGTSLGDAVGSVRAISDGANAGTRVRWYQPAGLSAPTWCWDIYPQSKYEG